MSASMWAYNEEVCCGEWCRNDCDICSVRDDAIEATERAEGRFKIDEGTENEERFIKEVARGFMMPENFLRSIGIKLVEVVRCADCEYNHMPEDHTEDPDITCSYWMSDGLSLDDFCSNGKRRSNG